MRITETHIARLTASGRHVKEIIGNVTGTSLRQISSDTFTDSWAILDILKPFSWKLSLSANDLIKWLQR